MIDMFWVHKNSIHQKRINAAILSGILTCLILILHTFDPSTSSLYPPSPFREITGLFCPRCGTLRALHQLLNGHLMEALSLNPLMVLLLPFMIYEYLAYVTESITRKAIPRLKIGSGGTWFLLGIIIAYWILRNMPIQPFSWLAP